jgi:hypothetical protein
MADTQPLSVRLHFALERARRDATFFRFEGGGQFGTWQEARQDDHRATPFYTAHDVKKIVEDVCGEKPSECRWPTKPLGMVQVTLPDGTSAALPPERAYFDAWAMQELENNLKHIAGVEVRDGL